MFATYTAGEVTVLIAAVFSGIVSVVGAIYAGKAATAAKENHKSLVQVQSEVQTLNGLKLGQLADNTESRRILALPPHARTDSDEEHVDIVGIIKTTDTQPPAPPRDTGEDTP